MYSAALWMPLVSTPRPSHSSEARKVTSRRIRASLASLSAAPVCAPASSSRAARVPHRNTGNQCRTDIVVSSLGEIGRLKTLLYHAVRPPLAVSRPLRPREGYAPSGPQRARNRKRSVSADDDPRLPLGGGLGLQDQLPDHHRHVALAV